VPVAGQAYTYDTTAPVPTDFALANVSGGTAGTVENGDTLTITFSEVLDASSLCSTWSNSGTQTLSGSGSNQVQLTITDAGANDSFSITDTGNGDCGGDTNFHLGAISLGGNYVSTTRNFTGNGASVITWNPTTQKLTIKFGTPTGSVNSGVVAGAPTYTPSTAIEDIAGNAMSATLFTGTSSRF
jgi:hypothetical protein